MHLDNFTTQVWTFTGGPPRATDADWVKQEAGTDRRCFTTTRKRENVLLQAKVCQSGNGGPAVNVLAGAMQNTLGPVDGAMIRVHVTTCHPKNRGTLSVPSGRWSEGGDRSLPGRGRKI